jgi:hypothetical protein
MTSLSKPVPRFFAAGDLTAAARAGEPPARHGTQETIRHEDQGGLIILMAVLWLIATIHYSLLAKTRLPQQPARHGPRPAGAH